MTLIFKNDFNNTLKNAAQDKIINKSELEALKNTAQTKDEKFFTKLIGSEGDNVNFKFKVKETAINAINYDIKTQFSEPNGKESFVTMRVDLSVHDIIAVPDHQANPTGVKVPEQVYNDFPKLRILDGILKVEDYNNILIRSNVEDLAKMPEAVLTKLKNSGLKQIEISNKSVVDMAENSELRNQKPRNWEETSSWDDVPGVYNPGDKTVAIGVGGNGSQALAIHELSHAIGDLFKLDKTSEMKDHHKRLYDKIDTYLKGIGNPGNDAGAEETFAEGLATLLKDGEEKAISRFDKPFIDYLKKEVLNQTTFDLLSSTFDNAKVINTPTSVATGKYNKLLNSIDSPSTNDNYNNLLNRFNT